MNRYFKLFLVIILCLAMVFTFTACDTGDDESENENNAESNTETEGNESQVPTLTLTSAQAAELAKTSTVTVVNALMGDSIAFSTSASLTIQVEYDDTTFNLQIDTYVAVNAVFGDDASLTAMATIDFVKFPEALATAMGWELAPACMEFYYVDGYIYGDLEYSDESHAGQLVEQLALEEYMTTNPVAMVVESILGQDVALTTDNFYKVSDELQKLYDSFIDSLELEEDIAMFELIEDILSDIFGGDTFSYTATGDCLTVELDDQELVKVLEETFDIELDAYLPDDALSLTVEFDLTGSAFAGVDVEFSYAHSNLVVDGQELGAVSLVFGLDVDFTFGATTITLPSKFEQSVLS